MSMTDIRMQAEGKRLNQQMLARTSTLRAAIQLMIF
jgi:hypothetical protein